MTSLDTKVDHLWPVSDGAADHVDRSDERAPIQPHREHGEPRRAHQLDGGQVAVEILTINRLIIHQIFH